MKYVKVFVRIFLHSTIKVVIYQFFLKADPNFEISNKNVDYSNLHLY